jgi:hypothetical protein
MATRISGTPDTLREGYEAMLRLDPTASPTHLCLASAGADGGGPTYQRLMITDNVAAEFQRVVANLLATRARRLDQGNFAIRPYDAVSKLDSHEVEHLDLRKYPRVRRQIQGLRQLRRLPRFSHADGANALKFHVIVVEPDGDEPGYFFRSCGPRMELRQSRKFALLFANDHYDLFREPLLVFDRGIDCFCRGDDLYILHKGRFEAMFGFFDEVREAASRTLETIRSTIPIQNFEELEAACLGHIQMLRKLKNIAARPWLSRITMDDIRHVIGDMGLSLQVRRQAGKEVLTFDPKNKWEILRLLDDDYLKSVMTGEKYEVNSKRTM